ncbi:MAG: oligoendopeptidase F [Betaproteobacteria bacterium]|nr:oligoendopeptidase F [Betaproteobacteria bacterium]
MSNMTLPKRAEVDAAQTWDLSKLFRDFDDWKRAVDSLPSEAELGQEISRRFKDHLEQGGPSLIHEALHFRNGLLRKLENLHVYAGLKNTEDVGNSKANEALAKIVQISSTLMAQWAFLSPELLTIRQLPEWLMAKPLDEFAYELSELIRSHKHVLSEREEALLTQLSNPLAQFSEIHSKWNNVDLKFPSVKDANGKEHMVSNARFGQLLTSRDRTLRENTFKSLYSEIGKSRHHIANNFFASLLTGTTLAKVRGFNGFLESQLFPDNIPIEVYNNLISTVRANLKTLHRSLELRRKVLGVEKVFLHDRYASLADGGEETKISFKDACDLILKSVAPLGEEYVATARKGLNEERWVDWAENEGKRSGAFSWGTYDSNPVMLLTWTGSLNDLFTLAHELGHSMHSWHSNNTQPYHVAGYTIFVAEVASTLNEMLLSDYILTHMPGTKLAKDVLSHWLQGFEGTVLRQCLFATFERDASARVDTGDSLTADSLDSLYTALNREWYGSESGFDLANAYEWMRIPHFYSTFYVYKYATSYCASLALFEELKKAGNETTARHRILGLLKAGGSKSPLDILLEAGVDLRTPEPIEKAFVTYSRFVERAEAAFLKK